MKGIIHRISYAYFRARGHYPVNIGGLDFKVDPHHMRFWRNAARGRWEPHTYEILKRLLTTDSIYCDVGAWVGPTVLYAAKLCEQVVCLEPDPFAYRYLCRNIEMNQLDNVRPFNVALSRRSGVRSMSSFGGDPGDSMASLLDPDSAGSGFDASALTLEEFLQTAGLDTIDVLKIDIEGGEFELLPAIGDFLSTHTPTVVLSTHAPFLEEGRRKSRMQEIADLMGLYTTCLDEDLNPIPGRDLVAREAQDHCRSYVFLE
jgi:FkbM family methyltransferase